MTSPALRANENARTQKITPHLWFDKEAKEAAGFYTSIFNDSRVKNTTRLDNTPSGSVDIVTIELSGREFTLISAGPLFKFTPAVSFLVACKTKDEVEALWGRLSTGGMAFMELGEYPFSEKYGWVQDRYGLSWQVMFMGDREIKQNIIPTFMFVGKQCGKAEEAINFYASVFKRATVGDILRYGKGEEPDKVRGRTELEDVALKRRPHDRVRQQDGSSVRDGVGSRATAPISTARDSWGTRPRPRRSRLLHDHHGGNEVVSVRHRKASFCD